MGPTITIPTSTFWLLFLLGVYGLFTSGIMLAVAVTSYMQRREINASIKKFRGLIEFGQAGYSMGFRLESPDEWPSPDMPVYREVEVQSSGKSDGA